MVDRAPGWGVGGVECGVEQPRPILPMRTNIRRAWVGLWLVVSLGVAGSVARAATLPQAVSVRYGPSATALGDSVGPVMSRDGEHVAWVSSADNLVAVDRNGGQRDVFVRDLRTRRTTLVSVNTRGVSGNGGSEAPVISADGRYVAFASRASDLVAGDTNGVSDVFLRDLEAGTTVCVSRIAGGDFGNRESHSPEMSSDGKWVVFESRATNLAESDTNRTQDVFLWSRASGVLRRVSEPGAGMAQAGRVPADGSAPLVSDDGATVVFASLGKDLAPVIRRDGFEAWSGILVSGPGTDGPRVVDVFPEVLRANVTTRPVAMTLSGDGRYLGVRLEAQTLAWMPGSIYRIDLRNGEVRAAGTNILVSAGVDVLGPVLSADGGRMVFGGRRDGEGLAVFRWVAATGEVERISPEPARVPVYLSNPTGRFLGAGGDGEYVAFLGRLPGETGEVGTSEQVLIRRVDTGETRRISRRMGGGLVPDVGVPGLSFSGDGRRVAFQSMDGGFVAKDWNQASDVFVYDWDGDTVELVSSGDPELAVAGFGMGGARLGPGGLSADGARLVYSTTVPVWDGADTNEASDVVMADLTTRQFLVVSANAAGTGVGNGGAGPAMISADGRWVAFGSMASDLVAGDTNGLMDIFLRDMTLHTTALVSRRPDGVAARRGAAGFAMSPDGRYVAFESTSEDLTTRSGATSMHVYLYDRTTSEVSIVSTNLESGSDLGGGQAPLFSPDGRWLAFESRSGGLVPGPLATGRRVYVRRIDEGLNRLASPTIALSAGAKFPGPDPLAAFSPDGTGMMSTHRVGNGWSLHWYELGTGQMEVLAADVRLGGASRGGEWLAYWNVGPSPALEAEVRVMRRATREVRSVAGVGTGTTGVVTMTPDGRFVVFTGRRDGLVAGDDNGFTDVFLWDAVTESVVPLSRAASGELANGASSRPILSADGSTVAFTSFASNLAEGDWNGQTDVFVVRLPGADSGFRVTSITRVSTGEVRLVWAAREGGRYRVEAALEASGPWAELGLAVEVGGGAGNAVDADAGGLARRFYRVVELP